MKLSKRGEYALRALIDLGIASEFGWPMLQISELASKEKLPIKFLEQIFTQLKSAGYVASRRGKFGGYSLARPMNQIKFGAIIRLIDGPLAPIRCVSQTSYARCSCPDENSLRAADVDVRCAERHQHNPGSLYSRRHRRDHASQISARQSYAAFSAPIDSACVGVGPKNGAASQQAQSRGTQSFFRVARDPNQPTSAKPCRELGETYANQ